MSHLKNGLTAVAEKVFDPIVNLGLLSCLGIDVSAIVSGVGVYGLIVGTHNVSTGIQAAQFEKDLAVLTSELESLTDDEKIKFFNTYGEKTVKEIGECVILLLNKIEMPLAANLIGRAHRLLIIGEIDKDTFHNYCHIIKNLNQYVYENLFDAYRDQDTKIVSGGVFSLMESFGLMFEVQEGLFPSSAADEDNPRAKIRRYMKTDFGETFYQRIIKPYV